LLTNVLAVMFFVVSFGVVLCLVPLTWVSQYWFGEGLAILLGGLLSQKQKLEKLGWSLLILGLIPFFGGTWVFNLKYAEQYYTYKYTVITLGSCLVSGMYLWLAAKENPPEFGRLGKFATTQFTYFAVINAWLYVLHIGGEIYFHAMPRDYHFEFYRTVLMAVTNIGFGYLLGKIPLLAGRFSEKMRYLLYGIAIVQGILIDLSLPVVISFRSLGTGEYVAILVSAILHLLMLYTLREIIYYIRMKVKR